jgi:hypothetical protein
MHMATCRSCIAKVCSAHGLMVCTAILRPTYVSGGKTPQMSNKVCASLWLASSCVDRVWGAFEQQLCVFGFDA